MKFLKCLISAAITTSAMVSIFVASGAQWGTNFAGGLVFLGWLCVALAVAITWENSK